MLASARYCSRFCIRTSSCPPGSTFNTEFNSRLFLPQSPNHHKSDYEANDNDRPPNVCLIHTNRHPVDTCVSCFSKLFAGEQSQTYDLAELGHYYRAYHDLMAHWRQVLPAGAFLDVQYEEVVGDVEGQARRILDYCGLEWDARVLEFHRHERPVKTASASQVRKPIYGSSVARWRNYERFLGPLLEALGPLAR